MPVAGTPLIHRILAWLERSGVRDVVLNLHHRPDTITRIVGDGSDLGVRVRYAWENSILGSAGGPRNALSLLDAERCFVVNGDTLTDVDLDAIARTHVESGALVTLALIPNPDPTRYGGVAVEPDGRVGAFPKAGAGNRGLHFIGVQAADAKAFEFVDVGTAAESVGWLYPMLGLAHPASVRAFVSNASFDDIGTVSDYLRTCRELAAREGRASEIGRRARIAAGAQVTDSILWDDVTVGPRCRLAGCVVADGVAIPPGSTFERRAIVRAEGREPQKNEDLIGNLLVAPIDGTIG